MRSAFARLSVRSQTPLARSGAIMTPAPKTVSRSVEWDRYAKAWLDAKPQQVWRRHSDALNARLLRRWLPERVGLIVKTDLFDEAVSDGLCVTLAERADSVSAIDVSPLVASAARIKHESVAIAAG